MSENLSRFSSKLKSFAGRNHSPTTIQDIRLKMDKTTISMPHSPIKANESSIAVRKMIQENNESITATNMDHNHQRDRSRCARCGRQKGDEVGVNSGGSCTFCRSRVVTHPPTNGDNVVTVEPIYDVTTSISNDLYDETYVQNGKSNGNCAPSSEVQRIGRKWRYFPGKNRFYCEGRIMTAPSIRFCVLSFGLIIVTFALFIAFDGPYLAEKLTVAIPIVGGLLFISVVVNMLKTSCSDPGILPRASQQESEYIEKSYGDANNSRPPPRTKDIVVNGQTVKSKYCFTCKMFRPPRASHCGVCDNCVDRFDHHCPFLGNCIGKRNYRSFYAFIVSLSLLAVFVLSCSITHLALLSKETGYFLDALKLSPTSAVVIFISFVGMWTVIGLAGFHTYLIAMEQTTNEDIKGMFGRANSKNPYSRGNFCQNCCFVLCGPAHPSLIDPRGYATLDFLASLPKASDPNGTSSSNKCNAPGSLKPNCGEVRGTPQNPNQIQSGPVQNVPIMIGGGGGQGTRPAHGLPTSPTSPQVANTNGKILTSNHHHNSQKTPVNSGNSGALSGKFPTYLREQRLKSSRDHIESGIHQGSSMTNQHQDYSNLNPQMRGYGLHENSTFGRNGGSNGHLSDSASSSSSSLCEHSLNNGPSQGHVSLSMVKIEFDTPTMTRDGASTSSSRTNNVRDSRSVVSTSSIPSTSGYQLHHSEGNKKDSSCPHTKNQYQNIQTNIHNSSGSKGRLDNTMINSPLHLDTIM